jgi:hypothetical protein
MRTRRAFRPALETMPSLLLLSGAGDPTAPVNVPTTPPPAAVNPTAPVVVPPSPPDYPYSGSDVNPPVGKMPVLVC